MVKIPFRGEFYFDNEKYKQLEAKALAERAEQFDRLYLELGGKLIDDYHAARVLPGYDTNVKLDILKELSHKKSIELLMVLNAEYIESNKPTGSLGVNYTTFALRMIEFLKKKRFKLNNIVISFYNKQKKAKALSSLLKREGYHIYYTYKIDNYPNSIETILSNKGFGKKPFLKGVESDIIAITAPGPNSGKMATALMLVYQNHKMGIDAGYTKLETFPVWNLSLNNPINIAYEAATADIGDYNAIDPFYKKAYGKKAVNYNRDINTFPLLKRIINRITNRENFMRKYKSPTDMGINRVKDAIIDIERCNEAAKMEIIRRYFRYKAMFARGELTNDISIRIIKLLKKMKATIYDSKVVKESLKSKGSAMLLNNKLYISKHNKRFSGAASVVYKLRNNGKIKAAINELYKKKKEIKSETLKEKNIDVKEILTIMFGLSNLKPNQLVGGELHTVEPMSKEEERFLIELGINATWGKL